MMMMMMMMMRAEPRGGEGRPESRRRRPAAGLRRPRLGARLRPHRPLDRQTARRVPHRTPISLSSESPLPTANRVVSQSSKMFHFPFFLISVSLALSFCGRPVVPNLWWVVTPKRTGSTANRVARSSQSSEMFLSVWIFGSPELIDAHLRVPSRSISIDFECDRGRVRRKEKKSGLTLRWRT